MKRVRVRTRHDDRGSTTLELLGLLPFFAMVAFMALQLAAIGGAMNMAENAARTGSRQAGVGGSARLAALSAVDPGSTSRTSVRVAGEEVTVSIDVPIVIPFIDLNVVTIERQARLPSTMIGGF